ncbi:hypothetical protein GCM10027073_37410 [Streptomyces chlorus]|uniref:Uncharacterized protein n=1 Tax=Streptomyces chlorus TaxID=887452 RepID=A0ABW1E2H4_9ACTN
MRSIRTSAPRRRGRRSTLAATGLVAALALTATACDGSTDDKADPKKPGSGASQAADAETLYQNMSRAYGGQ